MMKQRLIRETLGSYEYEPLRIVEAKRWQEVEFLCRDILQLEFQEAFDVVVSSNTKGKGIDTVYLRYTREGA
jgi:hypothetical protein